MDPNKEDNEDSIKKDLKLANFNSQLETELINNKINIITEEEIVRGDPIGKGAFGEVFKGTYKEYQVAIKELIFNVGDENFDAAQKIKEIVNEINIIILAKHDNVPIFYGIWKRQSKLNLIFEFIEGSMLLDFYKKITSDEKVQLLIQLTKIIEFMHSKKLIHRDIKPGNVMIKESENKVYLIDFGTSKIAKNTKTMTAAPSGTVAYLPPEAFEVDMNVESEDGKILEITPKYDIWSMGCMISEIFSEIIPWSNKVKNNLGIQNKLIIKTPFPIPSGGKSKKIPQPIIDIINKCVEINVNNRCSATQLLEMLQNVGKLD
jgi:serine/threonine protein kinase